MTTKTPRHRAPRIEWPTAAVLTAMLTALVAVWALASHEQRDTMLTGIAALGSVVLAVMRAMLSAQDAPPSMGEPSAPIAPSPNGIDKHDPLSRDSDRGALRVGALLLSLVCLPALGCGASALRAHATVATVASASLGAAAPLVAPSCDLALASCAGGEPCITETAERCRVAAAATEGLIASTALYIDAIDAAALADEGLVMPALLALAASLARAWASAVAALAGVGVTLPGLPPVVGSLLGGAS